MINNTTLEHIITSEAIIIGLINDIISCFGQRDWRDCKTVEVHSFEGSKSQLVNQLNANGFKVAFSSFRYSKTVELVFEDSYYGSYDLRDADVVNELLTDSDFKKKVAMYEEDVGLVEAGIF